jgi:ribosomal protein S18 acetylase RimI-like enzyme
MSEDNSKISYFLGIPEGHRRQAAILFDEAFESKFSLAISSRERRISVLSSALDLTYAFCAFRNSEVVGLAGFHTHEGSLFSRMTIRMLISHLGFLRGIWAAFIFSLYERKPEPDELILDAIVVSAGVRGLGIGTHLLSELTSFAIVKKSRIVRLEVIDINKRAKSLYEREGFAAIKTQHFERLRWFFGFGGSTTMQRILAAESFEIRTATATDASQLWRLKRQLHSESEFLRLSRFQKLRTVWYEHRALKSPSRVTLVACEGKRIVAYLTGEIETNEKCVQKIDVGVLQEYQKKGLGKRLMDALHDFAKERNLGQIRLTCMAHNRGAMALYERLHYQIEGRGECKLYGSGKLVEEYYLKKSLSST